MLTSIFDFTQGYLTTLSIVTIPSQISGTNMSNKAGINSFLFLDSITLGFHNSLFVTSATSI